MDVTSIWLGRFAQYMATTHDTKHGDHTVSSAGNLKESTQKKRLDILQEFYGYLKDLEVASITQVDIIRKFKKTIKRVPTNKETLEIDEIHALYRYKCEKAHHEAIKDVFVFLCLTGVRFQDMSHFDRRFIQEAKDGGAPIYVKKASKTNNERNQEDVMDHTAKQHHLTEEELRLKVPSDQMSLFKNRVAWAINYLKMWGLVHYVRRGISQITPAGITIVKLDISFINIAYLKTLDSFKA